MPRQNPVKPVGTRRSVDSTGERKKRGKRPYAAPTQKTHVVLAARDLFLKTRFGRRRTFEPVAV